MSSPYKKYKRTDIAELRPVTKEDIDQYNRCGYIADHDLGTIVNNVSIYFKDLNNGSPKLGDVIARNPKYHAEQWLISEKDFKANFKAIKEKPINGYAVIKGDKFITSTYLLFGTDIDKLHVYKTLKGAESMRDCLQTKGEKAVHVANVIDGVIQYNEIL